MHGIKLYVTALHYFMSPFAGFYRLAGLVVKASALGAEDPRFKSRLSRDFYRVESYQ